MSASERRTDLRRIATFQENSTMYSAPRKKMFIDRKVQGTLIYRVVIYWGLFVFGMFSLLAGFPLMLSLLVPSPGAPTTGQILAQTFRVFWPALFASGLMLPLLILDVIRVSHRFVGPLYRLRGALRDLAEGKAVAKVKFRSDDFWFDLAEEFNRAAARVNLLAGTNTPPPGTPRSAETVVDAAK
jgi:hypothetical protein